MKNWKGLGRKQSLPDLRHYPGISLYRMRKTTKTSQYTQCPGRDLNPGSPEYEAGMLTTLPRILVATQVLTLFLVSERFSRKF
jgi:hypothetical protein